MTNNPTWQSIQPSYEALVTQAQRAGYSVRWYGDLEFVIHEPQAAFQMSADGIQQAQKWLAAKQQELTTNS